MRIILLTHKHQPSKALSVNFVVVLALSVAILSVAGLTGYSLGVRYNWVDSNMLPHDFSEKWTGDIKKQSDRLDEALSNVDQKFNALTIRMAQVQAHLVRLDALGERLVDSAGLRGEEFDFTSEPPIGGPDETLGELEHAYSRPSFLKELEKLAKEIEEKETQLSVLSELLANRKLNDSVFIAGQPILHGWMSSHFGRRTDPFTGRLAWHSGVDFAGKEGSAIISVAAGVVTRAGDQDGYGNLVEINHGNGYVTRYGHCKEIKVKVGDLVRSGSQIATMGSTGRSTGPHVHFEVLKEGRHLNPAQYISRQKKSS